MSYTKKLNWRDHVIDFEYQYAPSEQNLVLLKYEVENDIPCPVEIQFIERNLYKWLDKEWQDNGESYLEEYFSHLQEKKYEV